MDEVRLLHALSEANLSIHPCLRRPVISPPVPCMLHKRIVKNCRHCAEEWHGAVQTSQATASAVKSVVATISDLAAVVKNVLAPQPAPTTGAAQVRSE
jgi:hypothetical protein